MIVTSRARTLLHGTVAAAILLSACSAEKQASTPPKPGTIAYSWYAANESWKTGDYDKALEHLSRLATAQSEYRERSRQWVLVAAAGVADGYRELADAYEAGSRVNKSLTGEYRKRAMELRTAASNAAILYAETIHDALKKEKDIHVKLDIPFPAGSAAEPAQLTRISKGISVKGPEHDTVKRAMATRGVVRFASNLAAVDGNAESAKSQFAAPPREVALPAMAKALLDLADLYGSRKLDYPKKGHALCQEASQLLSLLPAESKGRKQLEARLKDELKRFAIKA
jgi:hypothetical protein